MLLSVRKQDNLLTQPVRKTDYLLQTAGKNFPPANSENRLHQNVVYSRSTRWSFSPSRSSHTRSDLVATPGKSCCCLPEWPTPELIYCSRLMQSKKSNRLRFQLQEAHTSWERVALIAGVDTSGLLFQTFIAGKPHPCHRILELTP